MKTLTFLSMLTMLVLFAYNAPAQFVMVTGTVKDDISGETIRQLSIIEKNSGIGTITSDDGSYSLALKRGEVELIFIDLNHEPFSIGFILRNDTTIHVMMKASIPDDGKKTRKEHEVIQARNKPVALKGNERK